MPFLICIYVGWRSYQLEFKETRAFTASTTEAEYVAPHMQQRRHSGEKLTGSYFLLNLS